MIRFLILVAIVFAAVLGFDWLKDEPGELALAGITNPAVKQLKFRFRYFQELAGTITLPEGFAPEKVIIEVKPQGKGDLPSVKQTFDWYSSGA